MKTLFDIDLHDYEETDVVFSRPSARAIIFKDRVHLALVYSRTEKFFKFPGGGIHPDEDPKDALIREVREETGLIVIPDTIREYGKVLRRQKSTMSPHTVFSQENYYYLCKVEERAVSQNLDDYEAEAGFELQAVTPKEAIAINTAYRSSDPVSESMIKREKRVLEILMTEYFQKM